MTALVDVRREGVEHVSPEVYLYHLPLGGKPLDAEELARLRDFVHKLTATLWSSRGLKPEYFIQALRIGNQPWSELLRQNSKSWSTTIGLGLRPANPLPIPPGLQDMLSTQPPEPLEFVYRIESNPRIHILFPDREIPTPANIYLGSGGCQMFFSANQEEFLPRARKIFAAGLDPSFEHLGFCAPLFGLNDFLSASPATIRLWFDLFDVFVGEVQDEDQNEVEPGILIASREPLTQVLANLQYILDG